jgi:hypothetical protein
MIRCGDMNMILENMVWGVHHLVEIGCELASVDDIKRDITEVGFYDNFDIMDD